MQNFIKTIINAVQSWTKKEIKNSTADWNQSDPSAVDYVKNRTHWSDGSVEEVVLKQQTVGLSDTVDCEIIVGQTYEVTWDNKVYHCVAWGNSSVIGLGDGEFMDVAGGETVPFLIYNNKIHCEHSTTHTISITTTVENIHKLDSKYLDLPTNLATTDDVQGVIDVANEVQNTAKTALANAATAQAAADRKMDAANPVGTGSFSMNRIANSAVGSNSFTLGKNNKAEGRYSGALGEGIIANHNNVLVSGRYNKKDWGKYRAGYTSYSSGSLGYSFTDWKYNDSLDAFELIGVSSSKTSYGDAEIGKKYAFKIYTSTEGIIYTDEFVHVLSKTYETTHNGYKSVYLATYAYNLSGVKNTSVYAHIVGNGTSDTERSNAHTLDWNGVGWFQGGLQVGGNAQDGEGVGYVPAVPAGAQVGQILSVKSVDENGKPTEWETLNLNDMITNSSTSYIVSINPTTESDNIFTLKIEDNGIMQTYPIRLVQSTRKEESGSDTAINQVITQYRFEFDSNITDEILIDIMNKFTNANNGKFILSYHDCCISNSLSYSDDHNYPGIYINSGHILIRLSLKSGGTAEPVSE